MPRPTWQSTGKITTEYCGENEVQSHGRQYNGISFFKKNTGFF